MSRTQIIWGIVLLGVVGIIFFRKVILKKILAPQQEYFIKNLHRKAQDKFRKLISRIEKETGYSIIITDGYRTFAQQQKEHEINSDNPPAGYGLHDFGLAIDVNATKGLSYLKKNSSKEDWEKSGIPQIARGMGFKWGGDYVSYYDPVHLDLSYDYDANILRQIAINQFGNNWDDIQGNKINLA